MGEPKMDGIAGEVRDSLNAKPCPVEAADMLDEQVAWVMPGQELTPADSKIFLPCGSRYSITIYSIEKWKIRRYNRRYLLKQYL